jgi:hypothetical protein
MFLIVRSSSSKFLASALDSAFFSSRKMNSTDFAGHRPFGPLHELWASKARRSARTLCVAEFFCLARTAYTAREPSERDDSFMLLDVREIGVCLGQLETCCTKRF